MSGFCDAVSLSLPPPAIVITEAPPTDSEKTPIAEPDHPPANQLSLLKVSLPPRVRSNAFALELRKASREEQSEMESAPLRLAIEKQTLEEPSLWFGYLIELREIHVAIEERIAAAPGDFPTLAGLIEVLGRAKTIAKTLTREKLSFCEASTAGKARRKELMEMPADELEFYARTFYLDLLFHGGRMDLAIQELTANKWEELEEAPIELFRFSIPTATILGRYSNALNHYKNSNSKTKQRLASATQKAYLAHAEILRGLDPATTSD